MSTQAMKQAIRQRIIADRTALPQESRARWSRDISARLLALPQYQAARCVLSYMSFGAEFDSTDWVRQVLADGKELLLPKVDATARELALYHVQDLDTQLAPGAYGIREPVAENCKEAGLGEPDFILLPGVAYARDGARLGYGGGFYDKLLMKQLAIRLGEQTAAHSHSAKSPKYGDLSRWLTLPESPVMAHIDVGAAQRATLVAAAFSMQLVADVPQEATDRKVQWLVTETETIECAATHGH